MMTRRAVLGIDCGTQSTKAVILDAESQIELSLGRSPHALIERPDGTREQQPDWWVAALIAATREALAGAGPVEIVAIGVSGQQHGLVVLGHADQPLAPAKLWNDTTTVEECRLLTQAMGGAEAALAVTGNAMLPGYTAPKLLHLRRHHPATYARAERFCLPHDYLNLWLTGEFVTEPGDASGTAYFDPRQREYAPTALAAIDPDRDLARALPPIVPSLSVIGQLRPQAAAALGLPPGLPVSAGGGDNMCAAIGVGAVVEGPVVVSLGTSGTAFARRDRPALDPRGEAAAFCDSAGGWLPLVCTLNCAGVIEWARRLYGFERAALEAALAAGEPGANGLTFLPYLAGERTPNRPTAAGALIGLREHHSAPTILRAVAEGVTFSLVYAIAALRRTGVEPQTVTLVGGGAASDAWAQLCADAFGVPVERPAATEAAAHGAALQALTASSGQPIAPAPTKAVTRDHATTFMPRRLPALVEASQRVDRLRAIEAEN